MTSIARLLTRATAVAAVLASIAACGSGVAGIGSTDVPRLVRLPADQIVFQVSTGGGFTTYAWALANRPELTVYPDGSAYLSAPSEAEGGGGPWRFRVGHISPAVLSRLVADAESSGLFDGVDFGMPPISDDGSTRVQFHPDSGPGRTADAYALSFTGDDRLTDAQQEHRAALRKLIERLRHSVEITGDAEWTPTRIDVTEADQAGGDGPAATAWPGPALRSLLVKTGRGRCGEVTGADASTVWTAAIRNGTNLWSESGAEHQLVIRGLLPGETACDGER
jgi:hypothetical protein